MSDAYNREELRNNLTKKALEQIYTFSYGISIETKSNQIVRDSELIKKIQNRYSACIKFSITTVDDQLSKIIEPSVCNSTKRFEALAKLSETGIYCGLLLHQYCHLLRIHLKILARLWRKLMRVARNLFILNLE